MQISIGNEKSIFNPGCKLPETMVIYPDGTLSKESFRLRPAQEDAIGEPILITGDCYFINEKTFDLFYEYGIKGVLTKEKEVIPLLRRARLSEKDVFKKIVKLTKHHKPMKIGEENYYWPIVKSIEDEGYTPAPETIKIIDILDEFEEINEEFDLNQNGHGEDA